ncbi:hypothetical protein AB0J80_36310 [Actinoplanes sp. NPDC049548]|uniref:hypothetical protein n=1 Tax=Actinoplanes sp. NPDC049548 TaxID=3155152 RepID=UPI003428F32D
MADSRTINTGGGWYTEGGTVHHTSINNGTYHHGDYAGRDLHHTTTADLASVFAEARRRIDTLADDDLDTGLLHASVDQIEAEVARGNDGDSQVIGRTLRTLAGLVPDVAAALATGLVDPTAGVALAARAAAERVAGLFGQRQGSDVSR